MILINQNYWIILWGLLVTQMMIVYCVNQPNDVVGFKENDDYELDEEYNGNQSSNDDEENEENDNENTDKCLTTDNIDLFCQSKEFSVNLLLELLD